MVSRRRWLATSVMLVVVGSVGAYCYMSTPIYQAQASLLIEVDAPNVIGFEEVLDERSTINNYYQTQYSLLQSRALAERTVAALELWKRPELEAPTEIGAVGALLGGLLITPVRGTRLVSIQFRSPYPELAAEIVNAHAEQYIKQGLENRFTASKEATDWLEAQLTEERKRVEETDSALQSFRERNDAVSLQDGQDIVVQKLEDLNAAVTRAKTARIEREARYRELLQIEDDRAALDSYPAILSNSFIQQLKVDLARLQREYAELSQTFGELHPAMVEKRSAVETTEGRLSAEVRRVVAGIRNEFSAAVAEEASLVRALDAQKQEAFALNRKGIEYAALEREAESVRLVYQSLLQRAKETSVTRELEATNIRIIDRAQPPGRPIFPRTRYNMVLAVLCGLLLAVGATVAVEFLDDRIETPDEIRRELKAPFLGLLPRIPPSEGKGLLLEDSVPAAFVEAIRGLRTSIISSASKRPLSLLIASASANEGKTLVAGHLALALAQGQERVLLVDADMRRPSVHGLFGAGVEPGLSSVLTGTATLADALRSTAVPGLTILTAGNPSAKAPELLGSSVFTELLSIMQEHFTCIVVDSPPVLSVTDANVLGRVVTETVFVVGAGTTRSRAARIAIDDLRRSGALIVGTVLNRVNLKNHGFYYSPYSRSAYGADFSAEAGGNRQVTATSLLRGV